MLRFSEEILLLQLRDEEGRFVDAPSAVLDHALAGAVLMDLALENRIDTDLDNLILVDSTPVGDTLLDPTLARIASGEQSDARYWVEQTARQAGEIRQAVLSRLIERGVLVRLPNRFRGFRSQRYQAVGGKAESEVKLRIIGILLSDEIPDPRDVVIICLANACGVFDEVLPEHNLKAVSARIEQIRKLDLIGQATFRAIQDIEKWLAGSRKPGRAS